jgi:hypothetical protein
MLALNLSTSQQHKTQNITRNSHEFSGCAVATGNNSTSFLSLVATRLYFTDAATVVAHEFAAAVAAHKASPSWSLPS